MSIASLGVGSGLDLGSLLNSLKSSEQARLQPLQSRKSSFNAQLSAYGKLTSAINNLKSASDKLNDPDLYQSSKVSTSGEAFTATSSKGAVPGGYTVSVNQLAQAQSLATSKVADRSAVIGQGGTIKIALGEADATAISVDANDASLEGIRDAINGADAGVSASIINNGSDTPYQLVLSSTKPGTDHQISVFATDADSAQGTPLADLLSYDNGANSNQLTEVVAAHDAKLNVNGIAITRSSNTVEDAIQGVTLSLNKTTDADSPQALTTSRDDGAVRSAIKGFVSAYSSYQSTAQGLTKFNGADARNGVLLGDSTARSIASGLRDSLNTPVSGTSLSTLSDVGISLALDGTLKIDDDKLDSALSADPRGVAQLFSGDPAPGADDDGVAGALSRTIAAITDDNGLLSAASDGIQRSIDSVDDRIKRTQSSIDNTVERYRQQFVHLDSLVSSLNATQSYLTTQLSKLDGPTSHR